MFVAGNCEVSSSAAKQSPSRKADTLSAGLEFPRLLSNACQQESATGHLPELAESSPHPHKKGKVVPVPY